MLDSVDSVVGVDGRPNLAKSPARKGIFHGWFILAAGFMAMFMTMGARGTFGVFILPMSDDFGWSRSAISLAISIGWLANGLSQPLIGWAYDRLGGRTVISASLVVVGAGTMMLNQIDNLWQLVVLYGFVISIAAGGASNVTIHGVMSKWFYRKRGVALSMVTAGASAGAMILAPFAAYLILLAGWRTTWFVVGALVILIPLPLVLMFVREDPADIGEVPDGGPARDPERESATSKPSSQTGPLETNTWQESFQSPPMWQLTGAFFVCGVTTALIAAHYVPSAIDRGASPEMAALAFGLMTGLNVVGAIVVGFVSDRFGRKRLLGGLYAIRGLAYAALILAPGIWGIWAFAVIAGFSWIATAPLTTSLTADIYGLRNIGTLAGFSTLSHQVGGALSVFMGGVLYDHFGSYDVAFGIAGALLLGATIASFSIREKQYSSRFQSVPAATPETVGDGD